MRELTVEEIRVLGCLVEKEATTPDNYPLSSNALVTACNQTTNRDPVVHYTERQVDQLVLALREAGLARTVRGDGQRVHKHKHVAGDVWHVDRAELALLSVLMLRGAQTTGELRTRTERHGTGLDVAAVERTLQALAARSEPLVRLLDRRPGEREARWVHLLGGEALAEEHAARPASADSRTPTGSAPPHGAVPAASAAELAEVREQLDALTRRFEALLERLGEHVE
jgi:uncharacterized protein YceH (UPF0502 family)